MTKPECAFGYCCERLYERGCLLDWRKMWICEECKNTLRLEINCRKCNSYLTSVEINNNIDCCNDCL